MEKLKGFTQSTDQIAAIATALAKVTSDTNAGIMQKLSTIEVAVAINTTETKNIGVKVDDIKAITTDQYKDLEPRVNQLERIVYMLVGGLIIMNSLMWIFKRYL